MKFTIYDSGSFKKPVTVYLITNCVDDAYVYTSKNNAEKKIKEFPEYTVYVWPMLKYYESFYNKLSIAWKRPYKKVNDDLEFDDTKTPWQMLKVAKAKSQWHTNRRFDSIDFAMKEYGDRTYYHIFNYDVPKEEENNSKNIWLRGFAEEEITDKQWLIDYKNKVHPNDEWTNVNVETYARYLHCIDDDERDKIIHDAMDAGMLGYLD